MENSPSTGRTDAARQRDLESVRRDLERQTRDSERRLRREIDDLRSEVYRQQLATQTRSYTTTLAFAVVGAVATSAGLAFAAATLLSG